MSIRTLTLALSLTALAAGAPAQEARPLPKAPTWGFGIQTGMNGIGGIMGVTGTWYVDERIALDAGLGLGVLGTTWGARARGFFLESRHVHPYAGLGFRHGEGTEGTNAKTTIGGTNADGTAYEYDAVSQATNFADLQAGVEFRFGKFQLRPGLGWSQKLGGRNWKIADGQAPKENIDAAMDLVFGSGPALFLETGFAF